MTKIYEDVSAPAGEQEICVGCGLCCDATLFMYASLRPDERGRLPEKIDKARFTEGGKDYFHLPCPYFSGKCTIYDRQRAVICSTYRCRLLRDFAEGKISGKSAMKTVREAIAMRDSIIEEYRRLAGSASGVGFRHMLTELAKLMKSSDAGGSPGEDYVVLLVRCNILEALLIKVFMADEEFEKLVMK